VSKSIRSLLLTTLAVYLLSLGVFLLYSLQQYPAGEILDVFRRQWIVANALVLFVDHLVPIQILAVLLTFSLFVKVSGSQTASPFFELVRPALVTVLLLAFVYTLVVGFGEPRLVSARNEAEYGSEAAEEFRAAGDRAYEAGNWSRAIAEYRAYLGIDPEAEQVRERLAEAQERQADERATVGADDPEERVAGHEVVDQSAADLVGKARRALEEEDFITAHYYARLALDIDEGRPDALSILQEARNKMTSVDLSRVEEEKREVYVKKREAYEAWKEAGDLLRAYRIFSELAEENPQDRDVNRYLPQVEEQLKQQAFFRDEIEQNLHLPGSTDVLFMSDASPTDARRRFFSIGRLVSTANGTYGRDFEFLDLRANGDVVRHVRAKYVKLQGRRFLMRVVERGTDNVVYRAEYLTAPDEEPRLPLIETGHSSRELHSLGESDPYFSSVGVGELLMMEQLYPQLGYSNRGVHLALAMRLVMPFSFVILSFFAIAAGWGWRKRYLTLPPVPLWVLIPVMPVVIAVISTLYHYLQRVSIGALLLAGGFTSVLIAVVLVQALLLLVSLAVLAGQSMS
jgi:hypothetical protein